MEESTTLGEKKIIFHRRGASVFTKIPAARHRDRELAHRMSYKNDEKRRGGTIPDERRSEKTIF